MSVRHFVRVGARTAALLSCAAAIWSPAAASQQADTIGARGAVTFGPVYDGWSIHGGGVAQPDAFGADSVQVTRVSQWALPIGVVVPVGDRWTIDAAGAYTVGEVTLAAPDASTGESSYKLDGLTDMRVRAVGRLVGDNVVLTLGLNLPTGKTKLSEEEFKALRVLAAPAFGFPTTALGTGFGATTGIVLARELGGWAWAAGASYELRRSYVPVSALAEAQSPDFDPGDATHLSLGADRLIGQSALTARVSVDLYGRDQFTVSAPQGTSRTDVQLGPTVATDWQLRLASAVINDFTIRGVYQYRSSYKRQGTTVDGSSGHYATLDISGLVPVGSGTSILGDVTGRYQTGLDVNTSLAAAGVLAGGLTLGVARDAGAFRITPFGRVAFGRIDTGPTRTNAIGYSAGLSLTARY